MAEIWKDIPGYEGFYQASNMGRVKSYDRNVKHNKGGIAIRKGRILKQSINVWGYNLITFSIKSHKKQLSVHRLIAKTFIKNNDNKAQINHKNGIKTDNRVKNLEWSTASENMKHALKTNLLRVKKGRESHMYGKTGSLSNIAKSVSQYSKDGKFISVYDSLKEAASCVGGDKNSIGLCCHGKIKTSAGYQWRFYHGNKGDISQTKKSKVLRPILQINKHGKIENRFESISAAAKYLNVFASSISKALKEKSIYKNYKWIYEN